MQLWKSLFLEVSMNYCWVHQPPPHPLLGLMMNSCSGTRFHSSSPENLTISSRLICVAPFLLRLPKSEVSWHQSDRNLGQIWWLEHIPKSYNIGLWPDKVKSCLAHLAGGPNVIVFLFSKVIYSSLRNGKTYSTSCSWWILHVSKVWPLLEDHVNAISKHVCGTPIFNKNTYPNANGFLLNYPNTVVWVMSGKFLSPYLECFLQFYPVTDIMLYLSVGRIYPWIMCLNTFSFPLFFLIW